jgi:hypothetical protein
MSTSWFPGRTEVGPAEDETCGFARVARAKAKSFELLLSLRSPWKVLAEVLHGLTPCLARLDTCERLPWVRCGLGFPRLWGRQRLQAGFRVQRAERWLMPLGWRWQNRTGGRCRLVEHPSASAGADCTPHRCERQQDGERQVPRHMGTVVGRGEAGREPGGAARIDPAASWLEGRLRGGGAFPRQGWHVAPALEQLSSEGFALFRVGRDMNPPACPVEHHLPVTRATPLGIGP